MPGDLSPSERQYVTNAFADERLKETPSPDPGTLNAVREAAKAFAEVLLRCCPRSADRSTALRKVREAYLTARESLCRDLPPAV